MKRLVRGIITVPVTTVVEVPDDADYEDIWNTLDRNEPWTGIRVQVICSKVPIEVAEGLEVEWHEIVD